MELSPAQLKKLNGVLAPQQQNALVSLVVDLSPVLDRIDSLEDAVAKQITAIPPAEHHDMDPVLDRLTKIEGAVARPMPSLDPIAARLDKLETAIAKRLDKLETAIAALAKRPRYAFEIIRDSKGKIINIITTATP